MATHVSHVGVHDHGFNNVSTYGHLLRLVREKRVAADAGEVHFYELALKASGAVQAARWTKTGENSGYIYSFNGPHSLFIDTMRSLRSLALGHGLGHVLMGERDAKISLLARLLQHASSTAQYNVYYGQNRDLYDIRGRTAQECVFNLNDGSFRCPNSQQGYSAYSTWTRGLSWGLLGFAEQLEFLERVPDVELQRAGGGPRVTLEALFIRAARAEADYFLDHVCADGIPMWDTAPPGLRELGEYAQGRSDPFNAFEPVDSSAAAIAAQGLLRLGNYLGRHGNPGAADRYRQACLTIAQTLFQEPYLSADPKHQGLILHSIYHRPAGWDYVAPGQKIPNGESSMWGDYHARELALLLLREARGEPYLTFYSCLPGY